MSKHRLDNRENMIKKLSLPEDLFLGAALFTMNRDGQLLIENHRGIANYTADEVVVRTVRGGIRIAGGDLSVESYTKDTLMICGAITQIELVRL